MEQPGATPPPSAAAPAPPSPDAAAAPPRAPEPLLAVVQGLLQELPGLLSDRVELLSLELQRAGRALAVIVLLTIAIAVFGVTAWLALWVAIARALADAGIPWLPVLLLVHGAAIALAVWRARVLMQRLALPATRRHLMFGERAGAAPPVSRDG